MPKIGVLPINLSIIANPINLKKLILFFDKIIVEGHLLDEAIENANYWHVKKGCSIASVNYNIQNIKYLGKAGLLDTYTTTIPRLLSYREGKFHFNLEHEWLNPKKGDKSKKKKKSKIDWSKSKPSEEIIANFLVNYHKIYPFEEARLQSLMLSDKGLGAYPILDGMPHPYLGIDLGPDLFHSKRDILKFVLSVIPEPADDVSWEQLIDFKNDPDTMAKYYALTKWINEVSQKNLQLNDIEDEYKYLYHQYTNHYKIHKMKYKQSTLNVITTAAIDVLTGQIGISGVSTSFFSIWKQNLALLEAETKIIGKEIAYIYKANKVFKR